jgi:hypothetical protein
MSGAQFAWTVAYYPLALRRRVAACLDEVHRIASAEGRESDATALLRTYREARGATTATTLPVSLELCFAL